MLGQTFLRPSTAESEGSFRWGTATGAHLFDARSWQKVSAYHFHRPPGEMGWVNDRHRVSLQLAPLSSAQVQVEGGRSRELTAMAALSFTPAGTSIKTVMPGGSAVAILQTPDVYDGLAYEMNLPHEIDFEPLWSINDPVLERLARLIFREIDNGFKDELMMSAINTAVAVQVARNFVGVKAKIAEAGKLSTSRLGRVVEYIDAHLGDSLSLGAIAEIACLSPFHFTRCFRYTMGASLHQFVMRRRIQRAQNLIAASAANLAEIAVDVGFSSQAAFTTRFVREVGMSPGAYRKACLR